jgi:transcriptional regulator with XRE-family HTH domain
MPKADFEKAKELYPSTTQMGEPEWLAFFDTPEGVRAMGRILGDIYREVRAQEDKVAGRTKMGRRPRTEGTLDEVMDVIFPAQYSMDPFPLALTKLMAGRSTRQFAPRIPCNQSTLVRLMNGKLLPDLAMLERIAAAAKVRPHYFVEYRAMAVSTLVEKALMEYPHQGITAYKAMVSMQVSA